MPTTNHEFEEPEYESTDWHYAWYTNFEDVDTLAEIRDVEANLDDYEAKNGAKFFATDTGDVFLGTGTDWRYVDARSPTVTAYAGPDLSTKLANALEALPDGGGRVHVPPRPDGSPWTWGPDLTIDPNEYGGSGYPLIVDTGGDPNTQASEANFVGITGGEWIATGADPSGGIRVVDAYRTVLEPVHMAAWQNGDGVAACISVENHDAYAEGTKIRGARFHGDIGVDFVPPSVTGGSGTQSFVNTGVQNCTFVCDGPGLRLRGAFDGSVFANDEWFVRRDGQALVVLEGHVDGASFV